MIRPVTHRHRHAEIIVPGVRRALLASVVGLCTAALPCCGASEGTSKDTPGGGTAEPVHVATVQSQPAPLALHAIGTVEAISSVTLKPQVAGRLTKVNFADGQEVKKGDVLFEIDPRPSQAALELARANLARDQALALDALREAHREAELFDKGIAADRERDQAQADADAKAAQVHADQAMVERAELDLEYCTIRSPLDGRVGARLVDPGDVVKDNETALVVINQIHPIYVTFSVPERYLAEIHHYASAGPLVVEARFPRGDNTVERGTLTFIDNQVDPSTGMIRLKGTFANEDRHMWPGQYVDASLILKTRPNAIVVPSQAVQAGPEGEYVFVVDANRTVEMRPVRTADTLDGLSVVESGLKPGEEVVTDGQLRLVPGAAVKVLPGEPASASQPAENVPAGGIGGGA
jgi:multidrug efflux system membrane fusion protein